MTHNSIKYRAQGQGATYKVTRRGYCAKTAGNSVSAFSDNALRFSKAESNNFKYVRKHIISNNKPLERSRYFSYTSVVFLKTALNDVMLLIFTALSN